MTTVCPVCNGPVSETETVCPSCGFKLNGATQQFKPVGDGYNFDVAPVQTPEVPSTPFKVRVVRGPQAGIELSFERKPMLVGRSPQCDIFLNDMTVSRHHAQIVPEGDGYTIIDNHSFNGMWVNNQSVSRCALKNNDIIQIGTFYLQVIC